MTEAPGRKTDAHLSSVPGGEGRAAKIGEVFFTESEQKQRYRKVRYFTLTYVKKNGTACGAATRNANGNIENKFSKSRDVL